MNKPVRMNIVTAIQSALQPDLRAQHRARQAEADKYTDERNAQSRIAAQSVHEYTEELCEKIRKAKSEGKLVIVQETLGEWEWDEARARLAGEDWWNRDRVD